MVNKKLAKEENIESVADLLVDFLLKPEPPTESDFKKIEKIAREKYSIYSTRDWLRVTWKVCLKMYKKTKITKKD